MSAFPEVADWGEHALGAAVAPLALGVYGDYECFACARVHFEIAEVIHRHGELVRYSFRHYPRVPAHSHAVVAAQAAEAAGTQGRFWTMHAMLFANQHALDTAAIVSYAAALGIDTHRFVHEIDVGAHLPKVMADYWSGARAGVTVAPALFVNGVRYAGPPTAESIGARIEALVSHASHA